MNTKSLLFTIFNILFLIGSYGCSKEYDKSILLLPNLPYPIAREPALVTVAGQGPEGLIVAKMCDQLKLDNSFSYKADSNDVQDKACLIVAEGVSYAGLKAAFTNYNEDKNRIERVLKEAKRLNVPVIAVFPGGKDRRTKVDEELADLLLHYSNYMIALYEADEDGYYSELCRKYNCRLTLVHDMQEMPVPLNSVFR